MGKGFAHWSFFNFFKTASELEVEVYAKKEKRKKKIPISDYISNKANQDDEFNELTKMFCRSKEYWTM